MGAFLLRHAVQNHPAPFIGEGRHVLGDLALFGSRLDCYRLLVVKEDGLIDKSHKHRPNGVEAISIEEGTLKGSVRQVILKPIG